MVVNYRVINYFLLLEVIASDLSCTDDIIIEFEILQIAIKGLIVWVASSTQPNSVIPIHRKESCRHLNKLAIVESAVVPIYVILLD